MSTEDSENVQKLTKVLLLHGKLKEGLSATRKVHMSLQKVPQPHEKLTKYPADELKLDGRYCRCTENGLKFTEGPADTRIVDTISPDVRNVDRSLRMHVKLT